MYNPEYIQLVNNIMYNKFKLDDVANISNIGICIIIENLKIDKSLNRFLKIIVMEIVTISIITITDVKYPITDVEPFNSLIFIL